MEGFNYSDDFTLEEIDQLINDKIGNETESNIVEDLPRYYEKGIQAVLNGNVEKVECKILISTNTLEQILISNGLNRMTVNIETGIHELVFHSVWNKTEAIEEGRKIYYSLDVFFSSGKISFKRIQNNLPKFEDLLRIAYDLYEDGKLIGILYGPMYTMSFREFVDIDFVITELHPDMLYLKSELTGEEVSVYAHEFEKFTLNSQERLIEIKFKNRPDVLIKY